MSIRQFIYSLALVLCAFTAQLSAVIIETPTLDPFEEAVQEADADSLVLFDVHNTLIIPKDQILRSGAAKIWGKLKRKNKIDAAMRKIILQRMDYMVFNPEVIDLIQSLQERKIRTFAYNEKRKAKEDFEITALLKRYGMDFAPALKGAFGSKPDKVFFISNKREELESAEKALKGKGIEFTGFHYTEADNTPSTVDEQLAEYQLTHLAKHKVWLSDEEALVHIKGHTQQIISQIHRLEQTQCDLELCDENTLVIFGVKDVLVSTTNRFLQPQNEEILKKLIKEEWEKSEQTDEVKGNIMRMMDGIRLVQPECTLVEPSAIELIKELQNRGIKVIALAKEKQEKNFEVKMPDGELLKSLGIDLSLSFPIKPTPLQTATKIAYWPGTPLFENGVLFSNKRSKEEAVESFLSHVGFKPTRVILVDSSIKNHENLGNYLNTVGISFKGFHYLGGRLPTQEDDAKLIEFQFRELMENDKWPTDAEARTLLKNCETIK